MSTAGPWLHYRRERDWNHGEKEDFDSETKTVIYAMLSNQWRDIKTGKEASCHRSVNLSPIHPRTHATGQTVVLLFVGRRSVAVLGVFVAQQYRACANSGISVNASSMYVC